MAACTKLIEQEVSKFNLKNINNYKNLNDYLKYRKNQLSPISKLVISYLFTNPTKKVASKKIQNELDIGKDSWQKAAKQLCDIGLLTFNQGGPNSGSYYTNNIVYLFSDHGAKRMNKEIIGREPGFPAPDSEARAGFSGSYRNNTTLQTNNIVDHNKNTNSTQDKVVPIQGGEKITEAELSECENKIFEKVNLKHEEKMYVYRNLKAKVARNQIPSNLTALGLERLLYELLMKAEVDLPRGFTIEASFNGFLKMCSNPKGYKITYVTELVWEGIAGAKPKASIEYKGYEPTKGNVTEEGRKVGIEGLRNARKSFLGAYPRSN